MSNIKYNMTEYTTTKVIEVITEAFKEKNDKVLKYFLMNNGSKVCIELMHTVIEDLFNNKNYNLLVKIADYDLNLMTYKNHDSCGSYLEKLVINKPCYYHKYLNNISASYVWSMLGCPTNINKNGDILWFKYGVRHRDDDEPAFIKSNGDKYWYLNGKLHREDDKPAIEYISGDKTWYLNDQRHRKDGPAIERINGDKEWWLNDQRHRLDGPAVERINGHQEWWLNGERHRKDGPAVEHINGTQEWWLNGQRHREDGPAIDHANGSQDWYLNGQHHREDGPAIDHVNGYKEWWLNNKMLTEKQFRKKTTKCNTIDNIINKLSDDYETIKIGDTVIISKKNN